jgi:2-amino-4-hydroxy-6-hydroxymethyldihydropteridine diphosphokinase
MMFTASTASPSPSALAFIALGSNLGDPRANLLRALAGLQALSVSPLRISSLWETAPVDCPPGSPKFLNAVTALAPGPGQTPLALLAQLQNLERELGRLPKKLLNEPRVIDLDLIAFGAQTAATPELTLPHPRAHLRRFVLQPLKELAPDLVLPGQTRTVAQLSEELRSPEILRRLPPLTAIKRV